MRVALSFPGFHRRGGVERVVVECAHFLARRGHETHVIASEFDPDVVTEELRCHSTGGATGSMPLFRAKRYAKESRHVLAALQPAPDVHASFSIFCPVGGVLWVQAVHRAWLDISRAVRTWRGRLRQKLNPMHPYILSHEKRYIGERRYRRLIALTDTVKADLIRYYSVPPEDVDVLPNGFSPEEFNVLRRSQARNRMRSMLGYRDDEKVVVFVANELERKGFGPLLRAAAGLADPALRLLVVGRPTGRTYAGEIERLGMSGRVTFAGSSARVADYYAAADAFALPTQYEAWGLVIVEAMACGLPVLTSRLAGAAVAVREGETGLLLDDPSDIGEIALKLRELLDGKHLATAQISASVQSYAWPRILTRYEAILAGDVDRGGAAVHSRAGEVPRP